MKKKKSVEDKKLKNFKELKERIRIKEKELKRIEKKRKKKKRSI